MYCRRNIQCSEHRTCVLRHWNLNMKTEDMICAICDISRIRLFKENRILRVCRIYMKISSGEFTTLIITVGDDISGVSVELYYSISETMPIICRHSRVLSGKTAVLPNKCCKCKYRFFRTVILNICICTVRGFVKNT